MRAESWIRRFRYIPKRRLCYTSCSCECAPIPVSIEKLRYFKSCAPACMNLDAKLDSGMLTSYQIRPNGDRKPVLRFLSQEVVENWLKENTASAWARLGESRGMEVCFILCGRTTQIDQPPHVPLLLYRVLEREHV